MGALVAVAPVRGASAATGAPAARLRVAVAIENEHQLALPADFGPHAAARAVAQGVTEACRPNAPSAPAQLPCSEIGDAPGSGVCVDETVARALSREQACDLANAQAEALDLSGIGCHDAACFEAEARRLGATHLLLVHATWADGLEVGGTLRDLAGAPATSISLPATYNPQRPRTGPQVLGILKWVARSAIAGELRRSAKAPALAFAPPPPEPLVAVPTVPAVPERRGHAALGWTLVGAGVAAGVAGGWLLAINGQGTSCTPLAGDSDPCAKERRTLIPGAGVTVAAAAALVTGVVLVVRDGHSQNPSLAAFVHSNGLLLKGWF